MHKVRACGRQRGGCAVTAPGLAAAVVVTRAESHDGPLSSQLRSLGLNVLLWPAVRTAPAAGNSLEQALAHIEDFDWIVFASRNAVTAVIRWLPHLPCLLYTSRCV